MSTIFKKKNSPYFYYESKGYIKQTSLHTKNLREANLLKSELDKRVNKMRLGIKIEDDKPKLKLKELFVEFEKSVLMGKKEKYRKQLYPLLRRMLKMFGEYKLNDIKYNHMEKFKTACLNEVTRKTTHNILSANKEMFQYAVNSGYIKTNPLDAIKFPSKKPTKPRIPFDHRYVEGCIGYTDNEKDKIFWSILLYTGLRRNDAGNLKPEHVTVGIVQQKSTETRKVVLIDKLLKMGDKIYNVYPSKNKQDKSLMRYKALMEEMYGIKTDIHTISHITATLLVNNGYDRTQVGEILGKSASVKTYAKENLSVVKETMESMFE